MRYSSADSCLFNTRVLQLPASELAAWHAIYHRCEQLLSEHPAECWLLYHSDSLVFSALLMALLAAEKQVVLPQNGQGQHIAEIKAQTDSSIGEAGIQPAVQFDRPVSSQAWGERQISLPCQANLCFYTSGSTGAPKRIDKQLWQLLNEVEVLHQAFARDVGDSQFWSMVSHQHIYGLLFRLLWPLLKGYGVDFRLHGYPEHIARHLQAGQQTSCLIASPAQLHRLVKDNVLQAQANKIQLVFSSGGPLNPQVSLDLQCALDARVIEVFGSTETGGIAWRCVEQATQLQWQPLPGIRVASRQQDNVLLVYSPYLEAQPYVADDCIQPLSDGQFLLQGRVDNVVKIAEKRVSLDELAKRLEAHPWVSHAWVNMLGKNRQRLGALLVLNQQGMQQLDTQRKFKLDRQFNDYLANWFEPVVLPKKYRYPPELPYNARGKLDRDKWEQYFD